MTDPEIEGEDKQLLQKWATIYEQFSKCALGVNITSQDLKTGNTNRLIKFLKKTIEDKTIKKSIFATCKYYYDLGQKDSQIPDIFKFVFGGVFGCGLGLLFTPFFFVGILLSFVSLIFYLLYNHYQKKKYKKKFKT